ncbi:MAG: zinc transporter ZntB [Phycisphaeraceae bacterium]|nr:MAG: zinc transporter ZntB [Phycisphaeraceae bacterium]
MSELIPIDAEGGLLFATALPGRATDFDRDPENAWASLGAGTREAPLWIHLNHQQDRARAWVREQSGLDEFVVESLLAKETRPRFAANDKGLLAIFRGVNMNPGAEPDDLIALQMWIEPTRIITTRSFRFRTITDLRLASMEGRGPATPGAFLASIARGLAGRLAPVVENLDEMLDTVEEDLVDDANAAKAERSALATIRRQAITYRRYMVPQRDAMAGLAVVETDLLSVRDRAQLRLASEQVARVVEDLEELRDRAAVTTDELRAHREAQLSRTTYLLTIVATVTLPLALLTGLLGINVGGIPGEGNHWAFAAVCGVMLIIATVEVWVFRKLRWL